MQCAAFVTLVPWDASFSCDTPVRKLRSWNFSGVTFVGVTHTFSPWFVA